MQTRLIRAVLSRLSIALLLLHAQAVIAADPAAEGSAFARIDLDDQGEPRALQLATVSYGQEGSAGAAIVDLIGAVHIGDPAFYAGLNERFRRYDALLYELVAPQGTVVEPGEDRRGMLSGAQQMLTRILGLSFQLDEIDYTAPNFVHADLSQAELSAAMTERGESLYSYFWRIVFASFREYGRDPLGLNEMRSLGAVIGSGRPVSVKTLLAYEMTSTEQLQSVFGDDADSALIGARNARAIEVLREQLDAGARHIGIFYGVAHLPDLESRLLALGLERRSVTWADAWLLADSAAQRPADEAGPQP